MAHSVFPEGMSLVPRRRNPIRLEDDTIRIVMERPIATYAAADVAAAPQVSIVVVTFNNLLFTRMCVASVLANTVVPAYELLVVDNGSQDGTTEYLQQLAARHPRVRVFLNESNRGFAATNNQGLSQARGRTFVLLNNDTIVPPGWLPTLVAHLDDPCVGLVGPTTNRLGNEAEIETEYRTFGEFRAFAEAVARSRAQGLFDIGIGSMFCLAFRRSTYERLGAIDEQFRIGMFEDVDYSERARAAGLRVVCANNVFVHHFGSASFGTLAATGEFGPLFHENRKRWEAKWQRGWQPPSRRPNPNHVRRCRAIGRIVQEWTPDEATIAVVSKGDDELIDTLESTGRRAWHFPQLADGTYAGHHPADSSAILCGLQELSSRGAQYLLIPSTSGWWLDHYVEFASAMARDERLIVDASGSCALYRLSDIHSPPATAARTATIPGRPR